MFFKLYPVDSVAGLFILVGKEQGSQTLATGVGKSNPLPFCMEL